MVKINEENQDSTLNGDNQENQAKQNAKSMTKNATNKAKNATKKVLNNKTVRAFILAHLPIFIGIIIAILLIIFLIGIIMLLITMPGLILGKLDEMAGNIWGNFSGYFTGDSTTAKVSKQDVLDLAQYVENMGYDIQTYGLGDVKYKDDGKSLNNRNGKSREIEKIGESVDGKNYLEAYIAADENTYVLAQYNVFGAVKAATRDIFEGVKETISNIFDNNEDSTDTAYNETKTPYEESKEYSTGMINIEGYDDYKIFGRKIEGDLNSSFVEIDRENKQMKVYTNAFALSDILPAYKTQIELFNRTLFGTDSIKWGNVFTYDLDNWLARYGRPKELFLAIHLSTMMPDLPYEIATSQDFNTKVKIGLMNTSIIYEVSATKGDSTIDNDQILDYYNKYCQNGAGNNDELIPNTKWTKKEIEELAKLSENGQGSLPQAGETTTMPFSSAMEDNGNFTKYALSDYQLAQLTYVAYREQGTDAGAAAEASLMANLFESGRGNGYGSGANGLVNYVMTSGWFASRSTGSTDNNESHKNIVRQVLVNGKRTLPIYVDEHDCLSDLSYVSNTSIGNRSGYIKDVTIIHNVYGSTYTFYEFPGGAESGTDPFGYTSKHGSDFCYKFEDLSEDSGGIRIKWPFIRSVTHHWFYEDIDFTKKTYRIAKSATKTIDYKPSDKNDPLNDENITIKLNATLTSENGIIYQVCEPETKGPNDNIVKVFTENTYYVYDGSLMTAKKIANAKAKELNKYTYTFNGEKYSTKSDMPIKKRKVNFEKNKSNTLTAFSILGNVHTEAAEYIYRNLKELVLKLGFLSENDLKEELKEILLWPIKTENQYTKWETSREPENWGGTIKCNAKENTVIAPSDAIVEKIEGDSITLKFTTINDETIKLYDYIYNKRGSNNNNKDNNKNNNKDNNKDNNKNNNKNNDDNYELTEINKDILTGMKITISNIEVDSSISENQSIKRGQTLGKAKKGQSGNGEIKITMQAIDKSIVEDLSEYFMQKHNSKYEEIMKYQMDNINKKEGIDIGDWGTGSSSENYFDSGVYPGNTNYAKVYNYLINKGFSRAAACGILGNMVQETTGADPNNYTIANVPDCNPRSESGMVIGIFQFTGGNYTRFINWCNQNSKDKYDPIAQTEFMIECIRSDDWINDGSGPYYGESGATEKEFEKSKNPETAASDFCAYYERCGGDESKSRLKTIRRPWAKKFYNEIPVGGTITGNADTSTWTKRGKVHIPVYKQSGQPWSNVSYGNGKTISSSGCGACALAMGVSGLTRNNITPDVIANLTKNAPTYSNSISEPGKLVANTYNLSMEARDIGNGMTNEDFKFIDRALDSGKVLVFSGSYTASGHYIIVYGKEGNNYYAADSGRTTTPDTPYSRNSNIFTKAHYQMIALGRK